MTSFSGLSQNEYKKPPIGCILSGKYRESFAFPTLKDRVPVILCKVIDYLYRQRSSYVQRFGSQATEDIKAIIQGISRLRYEIQTNKGLYKLNSRTKDAFIWNDYSSYIAELEGSEPRWFTTRWLYAECYVYRRLHESVYNTRVLKNIDVFQSQKRQGFFNSLSDILAASQELIHLLQNESQEAFESLLEICLWGNKFDLSLSSGNIESSFNPVDLTLSLKSKILVNDSTLVWKSINEKSAIETVDFVMDNCGFELFTDLILADYMIQHQLATFIRFHIKDRPWFVSDTTQEDFDWTLKQFISNESTILQHFGKKWISYLKDGIWTIHSDSFWTYPHDYSQMKHLDSKLYNKLSEAKIIFFKGDLNYRKLVGDRNWEPTTSFQKALQNFFPSTIVSLRTLKADVVVGLKEGQADILNSQFDSSWMTSGSHGLIQIYHKNEVL